MPCQNSQPLNTKSKYKVRNEHPAVTSSLFIKQNTLTSKYNYHRCIEQQTALNTNQYFVSIHNKNF